MKSQIRIYTIKKGELITFVEEWIAKIKPLRIKIGFDVPQSWIIISLSGYSLWRIVMTGINSKRNIKIQKRENL